MATHEIYVGGPARVNGGRSQFPSAPFDADSAVFQRMSPAVHKGPSQYALTRVLDFGNDHALMDYVRNNAIVQGDVLNIQVIPANTLLYGLHVAVEEPQAGLVLTFGLDDGTQFVTGVAPAPNVATDAESSMFAPPGAAAWITDGAASLATAEFANVPKMLQATVATLPAGGFGKLRIAVSPLLSQLKEGQY